MNQRIEELLRCAICLDRYNNPKLLPCQHTFCESPCLEGLVRGLSRTLKCPECRAEHRVPYQGVSAFPNNLTIRSFLELPIGNEVSDEPVAPVNANEANNFEDEHYTNGAYCCVEAEPEVESERENSPPRYPFRLHLRPHYPIEAPRRRCPECTREVDLMRCPHCDAVICASCKRSHIDQIHRDATRVFSQIRRGLQRLTDIITGTERKFDNVRDKADTVKSDITEAIDRYIMELKGRQRILHNEVETFLQGEIRSLTLQKNNIESDLALIASFCDLNEARLGRRYVAIPDEDIIDLKRLCNEHMERLRSYDVLTYRPLREHTLDFVVDGARLSNCISNLGEILSNRPDVFMVDRSSPETSPEVMTPVSSNETPTTTLLTPPTPAMNTDTLTEVISDPPSFDLEYSPVSTPDIVSNVSLSNINNSVSSYISNRTFDAILSPATSNLLNPRHSQMSRIDSGTTYSTWSTSPFSTSRLSTLPSSSLYTSSSITPTTSDTFPYNVLMPYESSYRNAQHEVDTESESSSDGRHTPRRSLSLQERRRHNLSDTRIATLMGGSSSSYSAHPLSLSDRRIRSLSTGASLYRLNEARALIASTRQARANRIRSIVEESTQDSRTHENSTDNYEYLSSSPQRNRSLSGSPRSRPPVRFQIHYDDDESDSSSSGEAIFSPMVSFDGNESTLISTSIINYTEKGRAIKQIGHRGNDLMEFTWPRGIAITERENNILVADSNNHRIQVFDSNGRYIKSIGSYGDGEGEFDSVTGVAVNSFGHIIVTDRLNHRIQIFDHNGNFQLMFGEEGVEQGQLLYPWGVTCDSMGFIYVCDKENHRIQVFQSNGRFVRQFGGMGHRLGYFDNPHYVAVSPDNRIYVSDSSNNRIQVFSKYGDFLFSFGSAGTLQGQMKLPKGIVIDSQGFVVVADCGNNRIQVFHGDGRFYCMFGSYGSENGEFRGLEGIGILGNGDVVVSDRENHRVQLF